MNLPIITLEVAGIRHTMKTMLAQHAAQMDEDIKAAVDGYCTPENLASVVQRAARQALDTAVREEIDKFFRYGDGRKAVAAAVKDSILSKETFTRLDDV
jgi:hypothetical protein